MPSDNVDDPTTWGLAETGRTPAVGEAPETRGAALADTTSPFGRVTGAVWLGMPLWAVFGRYAPDSGLVAAGFGTILPFDKVICGAGVSCDVSVAAGLTTTSPLDKVSCDATAVPCGVFVAAGLATTSPLDKVSCDAAVPWAVFVAAGFGTTSPLDRVS